MTETDVRPDSRESMSKQQEVKQEYVLVDAGAFHLFLCSALPHGGIVPLVPVTEYSELVRLVREPIAIDDNNQITANPLALAYHRLEDDAKSNYDRWIRDFSGERWGIVPGHLVPLSTTGVDMKDGDLVANVMFTVGERIGELGSRLTSGLTKSELMLLYYARNPGIRFICVEHNKTEHFFPAAREMGINPWPEVISKAQWELHLPGSTAGSDAGGTTIHVNMGDTYDLSSANVENSSIGPNSQQINNSQASAAGELQAAAAELRTILAQLEVEADIDEASTAAEALEAGDESAAEAAVSRIGESLLETAEATGKAALSAWLRSKLGV